MKFEYSLSILQRALQSAQSQLSCAEADVGQAENDKKRALSNVERNKKDLIELRAAIKKLGG